MKKTRNTFAICFKIAKQNKGVLYYDSSRKKYNYSICRDLYGEVVCDFRATNRYGITLSNIDRRMFYNVIK